jgi:hypothetical protein
MWLTPRNSHNLEETMAVIGGIIYTAIVVIFLSFCIAAVCTLYYYVFSALF